jgi:2-polyprenyl-6-hydroxyphenyl methylase/3-demethylubiquinone-9 3-methyltransferase
VQPGGKLVVSTLNRTPKAFWLGIVAAEYALRIVEPGTHEWAKFVTPAEMRALLEQPGPDGGSGGSMRVVNGPLGLRYNPLAGRWTLERKDVDVNYAMIAQKD